MHVGLCAPYIQHDTTLYHGPTQTMWSLPNEVSTVGRGFPADAEKPEDWDDEEDGDWEPPSIPNPKCTDGPGCGTWKKPKISNPEYKGKWSAPLIDNPDYKVCLLLEIALLASTYPNSPSFFVAPLVTYSRSMHTLHLLCL